MGTLKQMSAISESWQNRGVVASKNAAGWVVGFTLSIVVLSWHLANNGEKVSQIHGILQQNTRICTLTLTLTHTHTHTHTHTFHSPLSGTTRVSWYQKGKTNLDFTEARDSEWQWHQLGHMQASTSLQTNNHASTPPLSFYRPDALPAAQPIASKHWRQLQCLIVCSRKTTVTGSAKSSWKLTFEALQGQISRFVVQPAEISQVFLPSLHDSCAFRGIPIISIPV